MNLSGSHLRCWRQRMSHKTKRYELTPSTINPTMLDNTIIDQMNQEQSNLAPLIEAYRRTSLYDEYCIDENLIPIEKPEEYSCAPTKAIQEKNSFVLSRSKRLSLVGISFYDEYGQDSESENHLEDVHMVKCDDTAKQEQDSIAQIPLPIRRPMVRVSNYNEYGTYNNDDENDVRDDCSMKGVSVYDEYDANSCMRVPRMTQVSRVSLEGISMYNEYECDRNEIDQDDISTLGVSMYDAYDDDNDHPPKRLTRPPTPIIPLLIETPVFAAGSYCMSPVSMYDEYDVDSGTLSSTSEKGTSTYDEYDFE